MRHDCDVIVIGLGGIGAAAVQALAARGVRAIGIERHALQHDHGASHGRSRVFREAYYEHPDYVPLLRESGRGWDALAAELGATLRVRCGVLYLGRPDWPILDLSRASAERHAIPHEMLDGAALAARFPQLAPPDGAVAMLEPNAGFVVPDAAVPALLADARRRGAQLFDHLAVDDWHETPTGVRVICGARSFAADRLVIAAGAWSSRLLRDLGVPIVVTRQVIAWTKVAPECEADARALPCWIAEHGGPYPPYGFPYAPETGESLGIKLAFHGSDAIVRDPDHVDREVRAADVEPLRDIQRRLFPALAGPLVRGKTCLYTISPDGHFIVDFAPGTSRVVVATGFSGHGFKFVPVMGRVLADLAMHGRTDLPVGFLGLSRF